MNSTLLSIRNTTVRLPNSILFDNLSFSVQKGEHWALVGESGSGKSALLQTIAGRFNATGGGVHYGFFDEYNNLTDEAGKPFTPQQFISFVEQKHHFKNLSNTTNFYYQQRYNSSDSEDALTVDQYLAEIKIIRPGKWTMERVIERLKLEPLRQKQLIKLSNGETKRLRLAAALLKNPVLLLLDSPLTGLDVQTREDFNRLITEITQSGIAVVMATSAYEIPEAITHVAILKERKIAVALPKSDFTAEMVGIGKHELNKENLAQLFDHATPHLYEWIVKMDNVNVSYSNNAILKNVNWKIAQGDRWALLGPNGAGKSTLLSLINGDNPQAYANDIILFDRKRGSGESIWDIKQKIGFVSPELHQYFPVDNSCLQVVESGFYDTLGLFRPSQPQRAALALKWMQALEIDRYARVLLKNVPASAQRLCLLARALIKNPALMIFDEPCQGMDDHQQRHFKNVVDTICSISNVTMIYVTHYQQEIPDSVDKVLRLDKGVVVD